MKGKPRMLQGFTEHRNNAAPNIDLRPVISRI